MKIAHTLAARNIDFYGHRPVTIVCLGDSVTHGCFEVFTTSETSLDTVYAPAKGYQRRLQDALYARYPGAAVNVINAGISGDSSEGGLKRLERDVLSFRPDLVTVNFGLNDSMNPDPETGIPAYRHNMAEIFSKVLESGAECMLVTPNMMATYVSRTLTEPLLVNITKQAMHVQSDGILTRYIDAAREEAKKQGVAIADTYQLWQDMAASGVDTTALLANGINHPTPEMHALFTQEILRQIFSTDSSAKAVEI